MARKKKRSSGGNKSGIIVVSRFRPQNELEYSKSGVSCVEFGKDGKSVTVVSREAHLDGNGAYEEKRTFSFDHVFDEMASQSEVYDTVAKPVVEDVLRGYHGCVFAYGQTSAGKTHTMQGPNTEEIELKGIIPRMVLTIFDGVDKADEDIEFTIKVSYIEIYMERIRDLIDPEKVNLPIHEDKVKGIWIGGATELYVSQPEEVWEILNTGSHNRSVAETAMNIESSRSHSIFVVTIQQRNTKTETLKTGRLYLVDLAGSEKVSKTLAEGVHLEEARNINRSLSALGNVIKALTNSKSKHIPYRDSKLTRVLQESIGGNSRTALIVCCSTSSYNDFETLSTLRFGSRAKFIKNKPHVNEERSLTELKLLLKESEKQIARQKLYITGMESELSSYRANKVPGSSDAPAGDDSSAKLAIEILEAKLVQLEEKVEDERAEKEYVQGLQDKLLEQLGEKDDEIDSLTKRNKELHGTVESLQRSADILTEENDAVQELRHKCERLVFESKDAKISFDALQAQNRQLASKLQALEEELDEAQAKVGGSSREDSRQQVAREEDFSSRGSKLRSEVMESLNSVDRLLSGKKDAESDELAGSDTRDVGVGDSEWRDISHNKDSDTAYSAAFIQTDFSTCIPQDVNESGTIVSTTFCDSSVHCVMACQPESTQTATVATEEAGVSTFSPELASVLVMTEGVDCFDAGTETEAAAVASIGVVTDLTGAEAEVVGEETSASEQTITVEVGLNVEIERREFGTMAHGPVMADKDMQVSPGQAECSIETENNYLILYPEDERIRDEAVEDRFDSLKEEFDEEKEAISTAAQNRVAELETALKVRGDSIKTLEQDNEQLNFRAERFKVIASNRESYAERREQDLVMQNSDLKAKVAADEKNITELEEALVGLKQDTEKKLKRFEEQTMRDLKNRCDRVIELKMQLDEQKDKHDASLRASGPDNNTRRRVGFLEGNLQKLASAYKNACEKIQHLELKNDALSKRNEIFQERITVLEGQVLEVEQKIAEAQKALESESKKYAALVEKHRTSAGRLEPQPASPSMGMRFLRSPNTRHVARVMRGGQRSSMRPAPVPIHTKRLVGGSPGPYSSLASRALDHRPAFPGSRGGLEGRLARESDSQHSLADSQSMARLATVSPDGDTSSSDESRVMSPVRDFSLSPAVTPASITPAKKQVAVTTPVASSHASGSPGSSAATRRHSVSPRIVRNASNSGPDVPVVMERRGSSPAISPGGGRAVGGDEKKSSFFGMLRNQFRKSSPRTPVINSSSPGAAGIKRSTPSKRMVPTFSPTSGGRVSIRRTPTTSVIRPERGSGGPMRAKTNFPNAKAK